MILYRYHNVRQCSLDEWGGIAGSWARVYLTEHPVIKETPKGYRLDGGRWVSKTSKKRFAHATADEAWKAYQARKQRQVYILDAQLRHAKEALALTRP